LPDAIISIKELNKKLNTPNDNQITKNKRIILSVGRLTRQKNFSYLIREFSDFLKINNEFILIILGEGEEREKLTLLINEKKLANKVFLLGFTENVYSFMKKSEIFILSSLWEEVGFAMVEASMCNTYIISSDCPNGPKEFLNNGDNGILFKNNVYKSILESLITYCKLENKKIFLDKVQLKKNARKYTIFKHYLELHKILKV